MDVKTAARPSLGPTLRTLLECYDLIDDTPRSLSSALDAMRETKYLYETDRESYSKDQSATECIIERAQVRQSSESRPTLRLYVSCGDVAYLEPYDGEHGLWVAHYSSEHGRMPSYQHSVGRLRPC